MFGESLSVVAYRRSRQTVGDLQVIQNRLAAVEARTLELETLIVDTSIGIVLADRNYNVTANAVIAAFSVIIPSAADGYGKTINVTKIDSTNNFVTISSSSPILGQYSFDLELQYESLTLFSNGTQWLVL